MFDCVDRKGVVRRTFDNLSDARRFCAAVYFTGAHLRLRVVCRPS